MKTSRPAYKLPSASTVSCDVKHVFAKSHQCIAKIVCEYDGKLSFSTDTWTSPNHKAFVAVMVTMHKDGHPITLVLDVVEVGKVSE